MDTHTEYSHEGLFPGSWFADPSDDSDKQEERDVGEMGLGVRLHKEGVEEEFMGEHVDESFDQVLRKQMVETNFQRMCNTVRDKTSQEMASTDPEIRFWTDLCRSYQEIRNIDSIHRSIRHVEDEDRLYHVVSEFTKTPSTRLASRNAVLFLWAYLTLNFSFSSKIPTIDRTQFSHVIRAMESLRKNQALSHLAYSPFDVVQYANRILLHVYGYSVYALEPP